MTRTGSAQVLEPRRAPVVLLALAVVVVIALVVGGIWWFGRASSTRPDGHAPLKGLEQAPKVAWSIPQGEGEMWAATTAGVLMLPIDLEVSQKVRLHDWEDGRARWEVDLAAEFDGFQRVRVQPHFRDGHIGLLLEAEDREPGLVVLRTRDGAVERSLPVPPGEYHELDSGAVYRLLSSETEGLVARYTSLENFQVEWETTTSLDFGGAEILLQERESRVELCVVPDPNRHVLAGCHESLEIATGRQAAWLSRGESFHRFGDIVVVANPVTGTVRGLVNGQEGWSREAPWVMLWAVQDFLLGISDEGLFRLDPRTGEETWRSDLGESQPFIETAGDTVILVEHLQGLSTAVLDTRTGTFRLQEHSSPASGFHELTEKGWVISIQASDGVEGVVLGALEPGRADPVWETTFPEYFWASNSHGHLLLQGGDTLAVAR
ncbi:MAG: hypothetical protein Q4D89_02240 [Arachnia propionica]|uniref:hypothetical protein n=1 Tax=Arachnia propionica TaxID=1750 RepID=UPI002708F032|nr:hypothetical protein [Arachnia propionica]